MLGPGPIRTSYPPLNLPVWFEAWKKSDGRCLLLVILPFSASFRLTRPEQLLLYRPDRYTLLNGRFARWRVNRPASKLVRTISPSQFKVTRLGLGVKLAATTA